MWTITWGLICVSLIGMVLPLEYVKLGAKPKAKIAITIYQSVLLMLMLTILTSGKFDTVFKPGHFLLNFVNAIFIATLMTKLTENVKWLKSEPWMTETCEYLKAPINFIVEWVWQSVMALDVELIDASEEPDSDDDKDIEPTIGEIVCKLRNIFYLNDKTVLNIEFARKIRRDHSNLLYTNIMIRTEKKFWSSTNLEKGLGEIRGFLSLEDLVIIAENTKYETYCIWEAI